MEAFQFFNSLPKQLQKNILARAKKVDLLEGDLLYEQGDCLASLVLLESGKVRVYRHHEGGQMITLYSLTDTLGANIDISSATAQKPCIGTAQAQTNCTVMMIPLKELYRMLAGNTVFLEFVFELFMQRNETLAQVVEDVRFMTLDERVLQWLKQMTSTCLSMSHEEIANYHGTSREVISRLLKRFEGKGYIKLSRRMIEIVSA